jgi:hypothetical protein
LAAIEQRERELKSLRNDHQLLALQVLITEEQVTQFESVSRCTFSADHLVRFWIAEINSECKLRFIHRTFTEYYVADIL